MKVVQLISAMAFIGVAGCTTTPEPLAPVKQVQVYEKGIAVPASEHGQTAAACLQSLGHNDRGNPIFRNRCSYEISLNYCFETTGQITLRNGSKHSFEASCNRPNRDLFSAVSHHLPGAEFRLLSRGPQRILYGVCPREGYRTYNPRNGQKKYACMPKKR